MGAEAGRGAVGATEEAQTRALDDDWPAGLPHHGPRAHATYAAEVACSDDRSHITYHCLGCGGCMDAQEAREWDGEMLCADCARRNQAAVGQKGRQE